MAIPQSFVVSLSLTFSDEYISEVIYLVVTNF